jgi:hypothetical protein
MREDEHHEFRLWKEKKFPYNGGQREQKGNQGYYVKCDACNMKGHKAKECEDTDDGKRNKNGASFGDFVESNFNGGFQNFQVDPPQRRQEEEVRTRGREKEGVDRRDALKPGREEKFRRSHSSFK